MKKALLLSLVFVSTSALAGGNVTYVGGGRYYCSGTSARCAQIRQSNDVLEEAKAAQDQARQEHAEREQDRIFRSTAMIPAMRMTTEHQPVGIV